MSLPLLTGSTSRQGGFYGCPDCMKFLLVFPGGVVPVVGFPDRVGLWDVLCNQQGCSLCPKVEHACRLGFVIMEAIGCALLLGEVTEKSLWLVG